MIGFSYGKKSNEYEPGIFSARIFLSPRKPTSNAIEEKDSTGCVHFFNLTQVRILS